MTRNFLWSLFCDDINLQLEASFVLWGEGICFLGSFCLVPVINADMQLQVRGFFLFARNLNFYWKLWANFIQS